MIDFIIKLFLTYSAVSMFSAAVLFFLESTDLVEVKSPRYFVFLWIGPVMIAGSIGVPYGLYCLWFGSFP